MKAAFLAAAVLATSGVVSYLGTAVHAAKTSGPGSSELRSAGPRSAEQRSAAHKTLPSTALSLPLFFEQNQGQTAPQVKFLARGAGYGLFLTADEAVLELQTSATSIEHSALSSQSGSSSVIRMRLEGANSSPRVSGASLLPGKSNYFIGNDPSKWRHDIPQFARVEYQAVYPGVDLVYYGNQGQLEYDFRVAPGADPNQITLSFEGASAHIISISGDSGDSGDLILSTDQGDVRFHAPNVYQPATPESGNPSGNAQKTIAGSFRQLADNKIGFTIGDYDHSRELVIDPVLSYSTYFGLGGEVPPVKVAIDAADNIYLAYSTSSANFHFPGSPTIPPLPGQGNLNGAQNLFIAVINPTPQLNSPTLLFATYLGGNGTDSLAGIAVDSSYTIYVAGTTTSTNFPTTSNALPQPGPISGTHGFVSAITLLNSVYNLAYSTYLAGNGTDNVTGLTIDAVQNAYVTGTTTSSNPATTLYPFPASPNGFQTVSNSPGNLQFFASKISTTASGYQSMLYSTYFGGGYPSPATGVPIIAVGGGIAADPAPNTSPNMYFTGTTNMLNQIPTGLGLAPFPLFNAQQSCLNESGKNNCTPSPQAPTTTPDAFVAKINPNLAASNPVYSTYIGGSGDDYGNAIDVDTSGNAYVTGRTDSADWKCGDCSTAEFQNALCQSSTATTGTCTNAIIAKIGNLSGSEYPMTYFTYLGGTGPDSGQDIKVDSVQAVHVVGYTASTNFPTTTNTYQSALGAGATQNAFVALISTTSGGTLANPIGDYSSYLGGNKLDQGTGVAIDPVYGNTYAAGITQSPNFPTTPNAYQAQLSGTQNAFVSKIGNSSNLHITAPNPSPYPAVAAGNQVVFTFDITNNGTDPANQLVFTVQGLPTSGLASPPYAQVNSGLGSCNSVQESGQVSTITCTIQTLAVNSQAAVEVFVTPSIPVVNQSISISGNVSANGGSVGASVSQPTVHVVDFEIKASTPAPINAGDIAAILVTFTPTSSLGYNAIITPSQTTSPSMVTAATPTFSPITVTLAGTAAETTLLGIATVARPVTTGSLFRRGSFYAAWLPIGGLTLVGLGIGVGRKRHRWLVGAVLCLIAGIIVLQPGCGSSSSNTQATAGGTLAGTYTITITGSAGTGAVHTFPVSLTVN